MPDDIKTRMRSVAEQMRELSVELDAHGTAADARPQGYADAYRCIAHARELAGAARMLESWAREMADG